MIEQIEKLTDILEPYHGQTVWCSDEDKVYRFDAVEGWQEIPNDNSTELAMNMYDINRQIISQMKPLSADTLNSKKKTVLNYIDLTDNVYFMLLCRDINYYTLFARQNTNEELLEDILIDECLPQLGKIMSIELTEDQGAIEIWTMDEENEVHASYFFAYDIGVIVCS